MKIKCLSYSNLQPLSETYLCIVTFAFENWAY